MKCNVFNLVRHDAAKVFLRIIELSSNEDFCLRVINAGRFFRVALCRSSSSYVFAATSCFKSYNEAYQFMCRM